MPQRAGGSEQRRTRRGKRMGNSEPVLQPARRALIQAPTLPSRNKPSAQRPSSTHAGPASGFTVRSSRATSAASAGPWQENGWNGNRPKGTRRAASTWPALVTWQACCASHFPGSVHVLFTNYCEECAIILIVQVRKPRPKQLRLLSQYHMAHKKMKLGFEPGLSNHKDVFLLQRCPQ